MSTRHSFACAAILAPLLLAPIHGPASAGGANPVAARTGARPPAGALASGARPPVAQPDDVPAIYGPGAVLAAGRVRMKVTNFGVVGNPFTNLSTDPSGQWPGASGVEYLNFIGLAVGAVNPEASDPDAMRRVSQLTEWRPAALDPADRMYVAYEGIPNGVRYVNDDGDLDPLYGAPLFDEDFLDGHDNDGDGLIDEDFGAIGQQEFTCVMRDDTPEAINAPANERHVPLGLECRQSAWCFSLAGFSDFNVVHYQIINRSGHELDSLFLGFLVDMDCGPLATADYFMDDRDLPGYPHGEFPVSVLLSDPRRQADHGPLPDIAQGEPLCTQVKFRPNGFSVVDGDGDAGATPGVATFLLVDHTVDPLGQAAPSRVGFRAFRSYLGGTPFAQGGAPLFDAERFAFMSGSENVDADGFVSAAPGASEGDYVQWCSVGPFRHVASGASVEITIAFQVQGGTHAQGLGYGADYQALKAHTLRWSDFLALHPVAETALNMTSAFDGFHEFHAGMPVPDWHGRESGLRAPMGQSYFLQDCRSEGPRFVGDQVLTWFDFDCDYCTGPWSAPASTGYFHHTWTPMPWTAEVPHDGSGPAPVAGALVAPNPTTGAARIRFGLAQAGPVEATIVDIAGRVVRRLGERAFAAGPVDVHWDGRTDAGERAEGGVYFYRVRAPGRELTGRFVLIR